MAKPKNNLRESDGGLWPFALRVYAAPGVEDACLELQDKNGVDVCCLLFAAWMGDNSVPLTTQEFEKVDRAVSAWRNEIIQPLRLIRRRLKNGPSPAPSPDTNQLREGVKAKELGAERIEIEMLEAEGLALANTKTIAAGGHDLVQGNLATALRYYDESEPDENALQRLATLRDAI